MPWFCITQMLLVDTTLELIHKLITIFHFRLQFTRVKNVNLFNISHQLTAFERASVLLTKHSW